MKLEFDVKPEDVEVAIKKAIIDSAIGTKLREACFKALQSYDIERAIEAVIKDQMAKMAQEILSTDEELRSRLREALSKAMLADKFLGNLSERLAKYVRSDY